MRKLICLCLALILACAALSAVAEEGWVCPNDDTLNNGNFCVECGAARPVVESWTCPACGTSGLTGSFCTECGSPRPAESAEETSLLNEGPGFDTPDEAARAYVEALNAGDVSAAVATFAVESLVDHVDAAAYLDNMAAFGPGMYRGVPTSGTLIRNLVIERRRSEITQGIFNTWLRYATLGTDYEDVGTGVIAQLKTQEDRTAFLSALENGPSQQWEGNIHITAVYGPEDPAIKGTIPDTFYSEHNQKYLASQLSLQGGDEFAQRIVALEVNGVTGAQFMQCIRYGDRWYNYTPLSTLAMVLGMNSMSFGLALGAIE